MANQARPLRRRLAAARAVAGGQPRPGGQDAAGVPATAVPRPLRRRPGANAATAGQALAGAFGPGQGGVLQPGPRAGAPVRQRLHALRPARRHHRRGAVPAPDLSLRADVLELGDGDVVLLGEPGEPERGAAECAVGGGRCRRVPPHRPADGGGAAGGGGAGVPAPLPRAVGALWAQGPSDPGRQGQRERRRRAEPPPVQARPRPGANAARQPGLRQPRRLLGVRAATVRSAQRWAAAALRRGGGLAAALAGAAAGSVPAAAGQGRHGQHDPGGGQRLLGGQPADRRVGRGAALCGAGGGVVRATACGGAAAPARSGAAPGGVPARDRLAGAQAGGLRRLLLPRRSVSQQPVPAGLRRPACAAAGAGSEGVPAHPVPGGAADGSRGRGGAGAAAGGGRSAERRGGRGGTGQG